MKALGLVFALVLVLVALVSIWSAVGPRESRPERPVSAPQTLDASGVEGERLARLEERLDELDGALARLESVIEGLRSPRRSPVIEEPLAAEPAPAAPAPGSPDPRWYLEQYVASFAGGGEGSEFFRLAVEAFAPRLLSEIGNVVLDGGAHPALRRRLVEMLGDARFAGDERTLSLLLRIASSSVDDSLAEAALDALGRTGDLLTARALERLVWSLRPNLRAKAAQVLVHLAGAEANAALLRLFPAATSEAAQAFVVSLLQANETSAALGVLDLASVCAKSVRMQAAHQVRRFRSPEVQAFVEGWLQRETDPEVRAALGAARSALSQVPAWSAARAIGPPDANPAHDDQNAWAAAQAEMGEQWLEVGFANPMSAHGFRIFEVCVAGEVTHVTALDDRGGRHDLWAGVDPTSSPGVFELSFPPTPFRVRALRITLDTERRPGWCEIDAVELLGPAGRAWASSASASSSYGG